MRKTTGAADGAALSGSVGAAQEESRCPGCGKAFACGAAGGACWCMQLAPRLPLPAADGARCLCPECLARRLGDGTGSG